MSDWISVSREQHAGWGYLPSEDYFFTAGYAVVPILAGEISQALTQFVMGFVERDGHYQLVALLGRSARSHHYVHPDDGRWLGTYVPALFRAHPFSLAPGKAAGEVVLQLHADHLQEDGGEPLFDASGELAAPVKRQLDFLGACHRMQRATEAASQLLADLGVLKRWDRQDAGPSVDGLYQIDESALNALGAEEYRRLQGAPMSLAYGQLFSMSQHAQLAQRAALQQRIDTQGEHESASAFFGDDDEDQGFDFGD